MNDVEQFLLEHMVPLAAMALALVTIVPYLIFEKLRSKKVRRQIVEARETGMGEPITIHPKVDRAICIGSGACVKACPEKTVLGMVEHKSMTICSSQCVGHGACARACPVGAIELVFGSERRGVDIPEVYPNFETNVRRLFIAGELGGMGLIKNSVLQGQEAVEYIKEDLQLKPYNKNGVYDLAIVGAGPAGLAAALQAKKLGLRSITLEREREVGGAILSYPRAKVVMTSPVNIPLYGKMSKREISKEKLMALFREIVIKTRLKIYVNEGVVSAGKQGDLFRVKTSKREVGCRYLLLCVGRRGTPRKLGVPGEKSPKVMYSLLEPERFAHSKALVAGGGDSAVEAAMALANQEGTKVTLSYRGEAFNRIKSQNREKLEKMEQEKKLKILRQTNITQIFEKSVRLSRGEETADLPNDYVFIFAGGQPPNEFLKKVGVNIETKYGTR